MDGWIDIYIYTNIKTIYLSISTCLHAYDLPFSLGWLSIAMVDHGGVPLWVRAFFLLPGDARHRRNVAIMRRFILHFWLIFWWNSRVQPGVPLLLKNASTKGRPSILTSRTSRILTGWWFQPLWTIWKSMGRMTSHTWNGKTMYKKCSKPPTSWWFHTSHGSNSFWQLVHALMVDDFHHWDLSGLTCCLNSRGPQSHMAVPIEKTFVHGMT